MMVVRESQIVPAVGRIESDDDRYEPPDGEFSDGHVSPAASTTSSDDIVFDGDDNHGYETQEM